MVEAQNPERCPACLLLVRLCLCSLMPRIPSRVRLVLVADHRELRKTTNTGALAARCLVGSEIHASGAKDAPVDYERLTSPSASNLLLFPTADAVLLDAAFCHGLTGPVRLIVPDGDWGQAARIQRKLPRGAQLTAVKLAPGAPSAYQIRRQPKGMADGVSTLEAVARAMELLEGERASAELLKVFRLFVDRTLWLRGQLPASQVFGGIPGL